MYAMYKDSKKAFKTHNFIDFKHLLEYRHDQTHVKWNLDTVASKSNSTVAIAQ
jgi:hypothetical protein